MAREVRIIQLELSEEDARLLEAVRAESGETRVGVLRWALRYYALYGPYTRSEDDRAQAIGHLRIGSVGLTFEEEA